MPFQERPFHVHCYLLGPVARHMFAEAEVAEVFAVLAIDDDLPWDVAVDLHIGVARGVGQGSRSHQYLQIDARRSGKELPDQLVEGLWFEVVPDGALAHAAERGIVGQPVGEVLDERIRTA